MFKTTQICLFLASILLIASCKKEQYTSDISVLRFSTDTLSFDTVFTEMGTTTRNFKVYNTGKETITLTKVGLANSNSPFRINVDGVGGDNITNVEILPEDSAWVFIDATIDPNGGNLPLVVTDEIIFQTETGSKSLDIAAWGQDAIYIKPNTNIAGLPPFSIIPDNTIWNNEKPIVIFGFAVVDSAYTLRVEAGTKVHFHNGAGLWVFKDGNIQATGTIEEPIVFQSDRLEAFYSDLPGQWDRIWINEGSVNNVFENVIIKNALIGLQAETLPFASNVTAPTSSNKLILKNVALLNNSSFGIYARNYRIDGENVFISQAGNYLMGVTGGGEYNFTHSTFVNYWGYSARKTPSLFFNNIYEDGIGNVQVREITNTKFTNCIVWGAEDTEVDWELEETLVNNSIQFENCLVKTENTLDPAFYQSSIRNQNPDFRDIFINDFRLLSTSPAVDEGIVTSVVQDFNGRFRDSNPDFGAFEYSVEDDSE